MSKCYLLGAGASLGYTDSKPKQLRPPGSWEFFLRGRDLGLLDSEILPDLYKEIQEYVGTDEPLEELAPAELTFDIENFLSELATKFNSNLDNEDGNRAHSALGQCFYFIRSCVEDCWSVLSSSWSSQQARVARPRHPTNDDANQCVRLGASGRESAGTDSLA